MQKKRKILENIPSFHEPSHPKLLDIFAKEPTKKVDARVQSSLKVFRNIKREQHKMRKNQRNNM